MSKIHWTEQTWNPVVGCSKISPGCAHCYAMRQAYRCANMGIAHYSGLTHIQGGRPNWTGVVKPVNHKIEEPLGWRTPKMVFVNSMSDLFHETLLESDIIKIAEVMMTANWHTYQVLTKRSTRMRDLLNSKLQFAARSPHIWWGVSVEDRKHGLPRIDHLRVTNAAVRFLSIEPLLEDIGELDLTGIDWVIIGGESGPGARPFDLAWARSILRQCREAGVACFIKQMGARPVLNGVAMEWHDRKGGNLIEWPQDLRVREFPPVVIGTSKSVVQKAQPSLAQQRNTVSDAKSAAARKAWATRRAQGWAPKKRAGK